MAPFPSRLTQVNSRMSSQIFSRAMPQENERGLPSETALLEVGLSRFAAFEPQIERRPLLDKKLRSTQQRDLPDLGVLQGYWCRIAKWISKILRPKKMSIVQHET